MPSAAEAASGAAGAMVRRRIRAALFDLDGTLVDTEPLYFESEREFLARYGIDYTTELKDLYTGRGAVEMLKGLESLFPGNPLHGMPLSERIRRKDEAYLELARSGVRAFPATLELARALEARGVALAIASGSSPDVIDIVLEVAGLAGLFPVRVSASQVARGKPEPDVFLEAARRLGVDPSACLVIEDSRYGIAAARAAGMASVALPEAGAARPRDFAPADIVVEGGAPRLDPRTVLGAFDFEPAPGGRRAPEDSSPGGRRAPG